MPVFEGRDLQAELIKACDRGEGMVGVLVKVTELDLDLVAGLQEVGLGLGGGGRVDTHLLGRGCHFVSWMGFRGEVGAACRDSEKRADLNPTESHLRKPERVRKARPHRVVVVGQAFRRFVKQNRPPLLPGTAARKAPLGFE